MVRIDETSGEIIPARKLDAQALENANHMAELHEAEQVFEHLIARVQEFEDNLGENEEIGLRLANFGEAAQLHIRSISYRNPNLIEFHGVNSAELSVSLIQHISQLNFMLVAMKPIESKPYRIGFKVREEAGKPASAEVDD